MKIAPKHPLLQNTNNLAKLLSGANYIEAQITLNLQLLQNTNY